MEAGSHAESSVATGMILIDSTATHMVPHLHTSIRIELRHILLLPLICRRHTIHNHHRFSSSFLLFLVVCHLFFIYFVSCDHQGEYAYYITTSESGHRRRQGSSHQYAWPAALLAKPRYVSSDVLSRSHTFHPGQDSSRHTTRLSLLVGSTGHLSRLTSTFNNAGHQRPLEISPKQHLMRTIASSQLLLVPSILLE